MSDTAKTPFQRSMKTIGCLLITISCVTPASSVFIVIPGVVEQAGSGALMSAAIGGVISLLIAFVYAELGSAFPLAGGEYAMVGHILGPLAGFVILGLNMLVLLLGIAVIALGLGTYVQIILPGTSTLDDALLSLVLASLCAILNLRTNALITGVFLALELAAIVVVTVLAFVGPVTPWSFLVLHPIIVEATGHIAPAGVSAIGLGTSAAVFAYYGFGSAVYLGEETEDAPRHIARSVLWALAISVVAQIVPLGALLHGATNIGTLFRSDSMFGDFVRARGGRTLAAIVTISVAIAIINANIAIVILASRVMFSTGRDRVWAAPINRGLMLINARSEAPWVATLATGGLSGALCFFSFDMLVVMSGTALILVYGFLCVAALVGRRGVTARHQGYRMPFFPWPPILALFAFAYIIYTNISAPETGLISFVTTVIIVALSAIYYQLILKRRGSWVLHGQEM